MRLLSSFIISTTISLCAVSAQAQQLESAHTDWNVFSITQQGKKVCYIASSPKKQSGNFKHRSEPYLLVTHVNATTDEASTSSGYPYKQGSEVAVSIGSGNYKFFTKGELAWAYDGKQDANIIKAMKAGSTMTIKGTSGKGTYSQDSYSLKGFSAAYARMKALCR